MDACRNPNILSMVTCKISQRKKLLFARFSLENMFRGEGRGLWWGHCKNGLYGTVHRFYWGCLQLSQSPEPLHVWKMFQWLSLSHPTLPIPLSLLMGPLWQSQKHIFKHWKNPYEIAKLTERGLVLSLKRESSETLFMNNFLHFTGAVKASDCQPPQAHRTQRKHPILQPSSTFLISHRKVLPVHKV